MDGWTAFSEGVGWRGKLCYAVLCIRVQRELGDEIYLLRSLDLVIRMAASASK